MSIRDDDKDQGSDPTPLDDDPGEGFDTQDEIAGDTPRDPSDGFEVEATLKAMTADSFGQPHLRERLGLDVKENVDDDPLPVSEPASEDPEEGFGTEHEIRAPATRDDEPPPSEGFGQERET